MGDPVVDEATGFVGSMEARGVKAALSKAIRKGEESFEATGMAPGDAG